MKVALICCGRLENRYAVEFVEYYKQLGFDHIYIVDNNHDGEEHFEDVLQPYIDENFVTIYDYRNQYEIQQSCYKEIYYKISNEYDWIAFFDFDEYLTLNQDKTIQEYLSRDCFKNYNQIVINWQIYTDNDLVYYENKPILKRFTTLAPIDIHVQYRSWPENCHVKSIIKTKINNILMRTPHNFYNDIINNSTCNNIGEKKNNNDLTFWQQINYDLAYIKHFPTKTIEEFITNKYVKGTGDRTIEYFKICYPIERFFKYNKITKEKINYLKKHNIDITNINEKYISNWFIY